MILTMKIWILTTKHFQLNSIVTVVVQMQVVKQSEQMNSCTAGHAYTAVLILFALPDIPGGSNFPQHRPSQYEHQTSQERTSHGRQISHVTDLQNTNTRHPRSVHPTGGQISHVTDLQNQTFQKPTSQEGQIFHDTILQNTNTRCPTRVKFPMTWASKYNTRHPRMVKF